MTNKLEDFRLLTYKERQVIQQALAYYAHHKADLLRDFGLWEDLKALELRISNTWCQPGGCSICNPEDYSWRYDQ